MGFDYQLNQTTASVPEVDFSHCAEMAPYLEVPKAMYVGAPGKHGYLRMGFEIDPRGKCIMRDLERRVPIIVQQELYFDEEMPEMPCVYILSSGGQYMEGDRYQQDISLKEGAFAFVSTGAATKIAEMTSNYCGLVQNIVLEKDCYLEMLPEPVYPCRHARFISDTRIVCHSSATLVYSEIYMAGRKYYGDGELYQFDIMSICAHGERPDGTPLFREKYVIEPSLMSPRQLGVMDGYDVFGNVIVMTPPDKAKEIYEATKAFIDPDKKLAAGITHLPEGSGLLYKVLGMESGPVKKLIREFCSSVRMAVKGHPIPEEFPWR
ncbi:MAG: urease accessory protein UreD [Bacteroidales bacterium]|nr:urease accessory protein UreD [Bacteroidales bacterium]